MTAGSVAILGPVGRNAASGMSGGEVFFLATDAELMSHLGPTELRPRALDSEAQARLKAMLEEHVAATGSARAQELLVDWPSAAARFVHLAPGLPVTVAPSLPVEPAVSVPSPR